MVGFTARIADRGTTRTGIARRFDNRGLDRGRLGLGRFGHRSLWRLGDGLECRARQEVVIVAQTAGISTVDGVAIDIGITVEGGRRVAVDELAEGGAVVTSTEVDQPIGIGRFAGEAIEGGVGADGGITLPVGGVTGGPEDGGGVIQDAADAAETILRVPVPLRGVVALGMDSARSQV
jgi:hypothetical protein